MGETMGATLLDEIVSAVLRYTSATAKNEITIDDGQAKEAVADLLRERLNQFLEQPAISDTRS